jgi:hypothetical protein
MGLGPLATACTAGEKWWKSKKVLFDWVRGSSRVVEHSPHYPEAAGSSPSAAAYARRENGEFFYIIRSVAAAEW